MSDNPQATQISKADVEAFFAEKTSKFSCPVCNEGVFSAVVKPDLKTSAEFHIPVVEPTGYLPSVGVACKNCGYVIFFYLGKVLEWVNQQRRAKNG